jgi:3-isopropylmalate/(R)-2-methylmalate dehydratase small subunit
MQKITRGKAFVVGDNIDTDQIIPAEHLTLNPADPAERAAFGRYAMSGVPIEQSGLPGGGIRFVEEGAFKTGFTFIVAGRNFGCGSSREHAPLAIAESGVCVVLAESYARIFYRNSVNGGYLLPLESPQRLIDQIATGDELELDRSVNVIRDRAAGRSWTLRPLGDAAEIIAAGGIFPYAKKAGMLK